MKIHESESCLVMSNLWDSMDYTVYGILQARILEWVVAFPTPGHLPNLGIKPRSPALQADSLQLSHKGSPRLLEWVAYHFSSDLPHPGIQPGSPALQVDSLPTELPGKPNNMGWGSNKSRVCSI